MLMSVEEGEGGGRGRGGKVSLTSVCLPLHICLPLRSIFLGMMCQVLRPGTFDDVFCPNAFNYNLIYQATAFTQDKKIKRIAEMLVVHNRILRGIRTMEPHLPARLSPKQGGDHRKSLLAVPRHFPVRFGAVALRVPELDVRLFGSEAHGIAALRTWCLLP